MPEDKALIKAADVGGDLQKFDDESFLAATKAGDYLPRLQLMTSTSDKCKAGDFPVNHYAIVRDQNYSDLGETVDVLVVTWRPKALEIDEELISVFDPEHEEFKRISEKSFEKDSGCMFGPEFLVWIPVIKEFATFFMGSKSARREAPNVKARLQKAATLKSRLVDPPRSRYKWQTPVVTQCSTPIDLPDHEELTKQVDKFNNPPITQVERAEEEGEAARAR
jgi:hypothetical protein